MKRTGAWKSLLLACMSFLLIWLAYFLIEVFALLILKPAVATPLAFAACWAAVFAGITLVLPRLAGRIFFGISFGLSALWMLAQTGYQSVFGRMLWMGDVFYAGEGAAFLGDVLANFPWLWWVGALTLLAVGVLLVLWFLKEKFSLPVRMGYGLMAALGILMLFFVPEMVFQRDNDVWGTRSEYAQSSSWRATYNTMYDAQKVYHICGIYQLTWRDLWVHTIYPMTPAYREELAAQTQEIDDYFSQRPAQRENEMTGLFAGKNVVMVLMESMDDWMITKQDTPTLYRIMQEGITFTDFYTPGYGTARTINSEFCANTGIYLPTNGKYVFNYVTNDFHQSIASRATADGYNAQVFHYNTPDFYSRGAFEPAMGYEKYQCYADYVEEEDLLYDDCLLFENDQLADQFFREGKTFNTIITRSAHLSYKYNEVLSYYGLKKYPQYRGMYGSQEEDCARLKAKLVDDMFARLLEELKERGQLDNTVILAITDHYTYGYKETEELLSHSGVTDELLLEKTPCFVWSDEGPSMVMDKTLNTADFVPTMCNLLGFSGSYSYLGQDAFANSYPGYVYFPDGSWIADGIVCKKNGDGSNAILQNEKEITLTEDDYKQMDAKVQKFIRISNLLLTSNYYQ